MESKTIGKFIASLRKANGYRQSELAEILGVSNKTISSWETDNSSPDLSVLPVIADLFHVTCDELLRGEKNKEEKETPKDLSVKSQKVKNNIIKGLKNKYTNTVYISMGIFLGSLAFLLPGYLFNHYIFGLVLLIIGVVIYLCGLIFSFVSWNNARNKINDEEDNCSYFRFIQKRKLFIQCLYSFFLLSPLFCYLSNKSFKDKEIFGITENDINNLNYNLKIKIRLFIAFIILCLLSYTCFMINESLPNEYYGEKVALSEEVEKYYTISIEKYNNEFILVKDKTICQYSGLEKVIPLTSELQNIPIGTFKFDIYFGKYDDLKNVENFNQHGFEISYTSDYYSCVIEYNNRTLAELDLMTTNKNNAYYTSCSRSLYEFGNDTATYSMVYEETFKSDINLVILIVFLLLTSADFIIYIRKRRNIL